MQTARMTHDNLQFYYNFFKEKLICTTKTPFFIILPSKNEFLSKFWTISDHNNEEIIIKHGKKNYVKFMKGFSGVFCINIARHQENMNMKSFLWRYFLKCIKNSWKKKTVWSWNCFHSKDRGRNFQKFKKW